MGSIISINYFSIVCDICVDKETGQQLLDEVEKALKVLSEYTDRMKKEEKERQEIEEQLDTFIWHQQKQLYAAKVEQRVCVDITVSLSCHCVVHKKGVCMRGEETECCCKRTTN